jgi:predicted flavoprotein YhiN
MPPDVDVIVIGAGAAGLLAATRAAERGRRTLLLEKNRKPGVKILMSGGTRCNVTHATDRRGIVEAFGKAQGPFLHSALAALGPDEVVAMFAAEGVPTKVEAGGKIFPVSDRALDVLLALEAMRKRSGAELALDEAVESITRDGDGFLISTARRELRTEKVVLTVGGQSYPGCGTIGEGYAWAKSLGHTIIPPRPALVPLLSPAPWVHELSGVTVPDVRVTIEEVASDPPPSKGGARGGTAKSTSAFGNEAAQTRKNPSPVPSLRGRGVSGRGSFLFTHFGLSGPVVMDLSRMITERPQSVQWQAVCDFVPDIKEDAIINRLASEAAASGKKSVANILAEIAPRRLVEALFQQARIPDDRRVAELSRGERTGLVQGLKATAIPISGSMGFKKAEVTAGGVALAEVDSRTMESKVTPNLFVAGEILDLDGPIGGYNFQAAFSTGWLAGESV